VAAMPSVGRIGKIAVAGIAAASLGVVASSASASEAWLWGCHGPDGVPVPLNPDGKAEGAVKVSTYGAGCGGQSTTVAGGGVRIDFSNAGSNPEAKRDAYTWPVSGRGLEVIEATLQRRTNGFAAAGAGVTYAASLSADAQESLAGGGTDLSGDQTFKPAAPSTPPRTALDLFFGCNAGGCQGVPASVDVSRVGLRVDDTTPPKGNVDRHNPVTILSYAPQVGPDEVAVRVSGSDVGVGLGRAVLNIDGQDRATANIGSCTDITPGGQLDLPLDASRCLSENRSIGGTELKVAATGLAAGIHHRKVTLYDAVGNSAVILDEDFEILRPEPPVSIRELSIGTSNLFIPEPSPNPNVNPNGGGTKGAQAGSCRSPRLSVSLNQKPLRISKGVPVLQYGKKYRFTGRLTCVQNGKRKSAPKRTIVQIYNKVGKKTVKKRSTRVATSGKLKISLKYPVGKRTIIFRFVNADKQRSQVQIRVQIVKKKSAKKR